MSLINTSIKSFAGQKSAMATRNQGSKPSKVYSPPQFGGNDGSGFGSAEPSSGGFGGNDSYVQPSESSGDNGGGEYGWWMCASGGSGLQAIRWLHVENVNIRKPKRFIRHPVETGTVVVDHAVEDPWMADVRGIVEDEHYNSGGGSDNPVKNVEAELKKAYYNRRLESYMGFILGKNGNAILDKKGSPVKFHLADYSSRISKDRIGIFEYNIRLQEIMTTEQAQESTTDPENADTQRG